MEEAQTMISYGLRRKLYSIGYPGVVGWHTDIYIKKLQIVLLVESPGTESSKR